MPIRSRPGRKILIASIGVATLNYVGVACGGSESGGAKDAGSDQLQTTGNLAPPPPVDATTDQTGLDVIEEFPVANLVAIPPGDAMDEFPVANLVAPPPMDAGKGG
jgi:hypothetical protein